MGKQKEIVVAKVDDLRDGEMKKVGIDDHMILLSRIDGKYFAVVGSCPHYGAPLHQGALSGHRLYCPWHHACFDARSGELQEPPARNDLPRFEVKIKGQDVILVIPDEIPKSRTPAMAEHDPHADKSTTVIIGGGAAGNMAAQTLREDNVQGRIVMITQEDRLPYDRPNLSKAYLQGNAPKEWMPLRDQSFFKKYDIEIMSGRPVTAVDPASKTIYLDGDESLKYDKLLLAPGTIPRTLDVPGAELENIFTLRSWDDADAIRAAADQNRTAVIVGASFIAMEVADSLRKLERDVTIVAPESVPFENVFGREIGNLFQRLFSENGVVFKLGDKVERFSGDAQVERVHLSSGEELAADMVVVGIGVRPATDFLDAFERLSDGSLKVDADFQVTNDVFAAGDIATFEDWRTGQDIRIEHWRTAEQQGRQAAHSMAGLKTISDSIPFFWTNQAGLHFRYVGHAKEWDDILIKGSLESRKFMAFFVKDNQILAVAANKHDPEMAAIEELMRQGKMPSIDALRLKEIDFLSLI